jgi:4-carboxymuconolactone decarboxylase
MTTDRIAALSVLLTQVGVAAAGAQDRMPAITPDRFTPAQKTAVEEFVALRGPGVTGPFGPFVPLLRSPELMVRAGALGEYLRYRSALPPRLSEMVILLIARQWTQQYEWYTHEPAALKAGLPPGVVAAIADGRRPVDMTEQEEAVYDLVDELTRNRSVSDATYARGVAQLGEQGVVDTAGIMGYYTLLAMVMNTARTALPDGAPPPLHNLPR